MTLGDLYQRWRLQLCLGEAEGGRWEEGNERVKWVKGKGTEDGWVWSRYQG